MIARGLRGGGGSVIQGEVGIHFTHKIIYDADGHMVERDLDIEYLLVLIYSSGRAQVGHGCSW